MLGNAFSKCVPPEPEICINAGIQQSRELSAAAIVDRAGIRDRAVEEWSSAEIRIQIDDKRIQPDPELVGDDLAGPRGGRQQLGHGIADGVGAQLDARGGPRGGGVGDMCIGPIYLQAVGGVLAGCKGPVVPRREMINPWQYPPRRRVRCGAYGGIWCLPGLLIAGGRPGRQNDRRRCSRWDRRCCRSCCRD